LLAVQLVQWCAAVGDPAGRRLLQVEHDAGDRALAASRRADQADDARLVGVERERDVVDRPETYTRASGEVLGHALDRDPLRFAHRGSLCLTSSRGTDAMSDRVYSCRGSLNTECTSPTSTTSPAFITATRS